MRHCDVSGLSEAAGQLRVDFVGDVTAIELLAGPWNEMAVAFCDHALPFFQSHAWCLHVARVRSARSGERYKPLVAKILRDDRLIGLWPLSLQRQGGAWLLKSLDDPYGQFAGVVFANAADIAPGVAAVLAAIKAQGLADGIQIDGVIAGTPLSAALGSARLRIAERNEAVVIDMRHFPSFEAYFGSINVKTRKNLRNLANRLWRAGGPVRAVRHDCKADIARAVVGAFDDRLTWLNMLGKSSTAFRDGDFRAVVATLPDADGIHLRASALVQGDTVLARQWGFEYGGRYYAYMSGRNLDYDAYSVGRIHLQHVIAGCYDDGLQVLELMPPAVDYKMMWATEVRTIETFVAPLSAKGWVLLDVWLTRLNPALRKASHALPWGLRRRLAGLVNAAAFSQL